jgi:hypothetical protein
MSPDIAAVAWELRGLIGPRTMTGMAGSLEALILLPVPGAVPHLPQDIHVVDLALEGARLSPITDAVRARLGEAEQ